MSAVDVLAVLPDWCDSMVRVTRDSFFATLGQLDVNPHPVGDYHEAWGYRSDWKRHGGAGERIGSTVGGTHLTELHYFVTPSFYEANRAALARVGGAS